MLTSLSVENAKARATPYKLSDGKGLHLFIQPNGSKLWRFRYRFAGKENMLALGSFPEVSLASARTKRDGARKLVAEDGKDPSPSKRSSIGSLPQPRRIIPSARSPKNTWQP